MRKLIKLFTINQEYAFYGTRLEFNEKVITFKSIDFEYLSEKEIKFSPKLSLGTLIFEGGLIAVEGINVKATISEFDSDRLRIKISSKVRFEHFFIAIMFLFFLIIPIIKNESIWLIFSILGLWIIFHSWFQFIYRAQENQLIHTIVSNLKMKRFK